MSWNNLYISQTFVQDKCAMSISNVKDVFSGAKYLLSLHPSFCNSIEQKEQLKFSPSLAKDQFFLIEF